MKETIITFIIALFLGSALNGYLTEPQGGSTGGTGGGESPGEGESFAPNAENPQISSPATTADLPVVDESSFQSEVIDDKQPVLVSFSRANCNHCRKMQSIVTQLAHEYSGAIKVVQADIMDTPELAEKYKIYGVPAFLMFDHGKVQGPIVGETPKAKLAGLIRQHVKATEGTVKFSG